MNIEYTSDQIVRGMIIETQVKKNKREVLVSKKE